MKNVMYILLSVALVATLGCGASEAPAPDTTADATTTDTDATTTDTAVTTPDVPAEPVMVEVLAEGTTFDPPVQVAQIPDGAWYCAMDTVHYARMDQGDGKCAVCGMDLAQKVTVPAEPTDEAADTTEDEAAADHT
jgi:glucose/arabinose dehydrogenase